MRRTLALALAGAVLLVAAAADATLRPQLGMSGVALGMTKAKVRARLGTPVGTGGTRFYYPRVWVGFRQGRVVEVTTTRSAERSAAGIGVDSSEAEVRRAYPSAMCGPAGGFRRCRLGSGSPGTRATDFLLGHGRVVQVTVHLLPS